jgi:hypothetical protein
VRGDQATRDAGADGTARPARRLLRLRRRTLRSGLLCCGYGLLPLGFPQK